MMVIDSFTKQYAWLNNFYRDGNGFCAEYVYQAGKALTERDREYVLSASTPGEAKKRGHEIEQRPDFDRVEHMRTVERMKYYGNRMLGQWLLDTGDAVLIEGNHHGDTFWGTVNGIGKNQLGIILMDVRDELRRKTWLM